MCHHLFIPLLEESRVAHDQTERQASTMHHHAGCRVGKIDLSAREQPSLRRAAERFTGGPTRHREADGS